MSCCNEKEKLHIPTYMQEHIRNVLALFSTGMVSDGRLYVRFGVLHLKKGETQLETTQKSPLEKAEQRKHNPLAKSERTGCCFALGGTANLSFMPLVEEITRTGLMFHQRWCRLDTTEALLCCGRGCWQRLSGLITGG